MTCLRLTGGRYTAPWQLQEEIREAYLDYNFHVIYQRVHNFCAVDLGGYYLDIVKDRQYTTQTDSVARRSAQTAMYHISAKRWFAGSHRFCHSLPTKSGQHMPGDRAESVFLETWYSGLFRMDDSSVLSMDEWQKVVDTRIAVSKVLEGLRKDGGIGSSLDAEVTLFCDDKLQHILSRLGEELRFVLITSAANVRSVEEKLSDSQEGDLEGHSLWIAAQASELPKCSRCWHHRDDVGSNPDHPELCGRCVENVAGSGEPRQFA